MTRRTFNNFILIALSATVVACVVGPKYQPEQVVSATQRIGVERGSDSTRRFFDSIAVTSRRDSVRLAPPFRGMPVSPSNPRVDRRPIGADSLTSIAWLDIINDTTL
ncbi:MAG: hypothetical protein ABI442_22975, partial [Gemmatimonadaceae bacterium]